jgi:GNAT superfamily N-acetyltransferase
LKFYRDRLGMEAAGEIENYGLGRNGTQLTRSNLLPAPEYSIGLAHAWHISALSAIELAAARLLKGHAPESVLAETTQESRFLDAAGDGRLWIASARDVPVGFALVEMLADDLPHLEELDVDPSHGRRGLGTALVRAVCEWATMRGYAMLTLTTFRDVAWNLPFYARLGFVEIPGKMLRPELAAVVAEESHRGLDSTTRAVMGYRCTQQIPRGGYRPE